MIQRILINLWNREDKADYLINLNLQLLFGEVDWA